MATGTDEHTSMVSCPVGPFEVLVFEGFHRITHLGTRVLKAFDVHIASQICDASQKCDTLARTYVMLTRPNPNFGLLPVVIIGYQKKKEANSR
jgi:hypothetical protein